MLKNITLGQFFPGNSFIHRLDPRTKILATIVLIAAVFCSDGFVGLALVALFILFAAMTTKIGILFLFKGLKPIVFVTLLTFVLNLFLQKGGSVLVALGSLQITSGGLRLALFMAFRLIMLVVASQLMTLTTSAISLTDGLESLFKPLSKLRFPTHEIAMMMSIALRFIPTLLEEAGKIMMAQSARGADFDSGNLLQKAKAMVPLLVPLFVSAFRRAYDLAMAMEARCYRGGEGRTRMRELRFHKNDAIAGVIVLVVLGIVLMCNALKVV